MTLNLDGKGSPESFLNLDIIETAIKQIDVLEEQRLKWIQERLSQTGEIVSSRILYINSDWTLEEGTLPRYAWNQSEWRIVGTCGTSMCLAGWICDLDCGEWVTYTPFLKPRPEEPEEDVTYMGIPAMRRAINVTGISDDDANYLFAHNTTIGMMKDWLKEKRANPE